MGSKGSKVPKVVKCPPGCAPIPSAPAPAPSMMAPPMMAPPMMAPPMMAPQMACVPCPPPAPVNRCPPGYIITIRINKFDF